MSLPIKQDIVVYEGDTTVFTHQYLEKSTNQPVDLTGIDLVMNVKRDFNDLLPFFNIPITVFMPKLGMFCSEWEANLTENKITPKSNIFYYDIQATLGNIVKTLSYGTVTILPEVTHNAY